MSATLPADARLARFSLALPNTWATLDLDPGTRNQSIDRLVRAALGTSDALAQLRRSAVTLYRTTLADAAEAGAFFAATLSQIIEGRPLTASALAFLGQLPLNLEGDPMAAEEMVPVLGNPGTGETLAEAPRLVELPIGGAVRLRGRMGAGMTGSDGREPLVDVTRFFVPAPAWGLMLVMAFSTPILPASDAFAELFDQLARTARWR
jgi:hypothetical protein